jgi:FKBP-type peptidyl-prolyl cis-trans isomerase
MTPCLTPMVSAHRALQSGSGGFPAWGIEPNSHLLFEIEILSYS